MKVCLPNHKYKLDNNLLTVEPRAVDPHCFDEDPDLAQNIDADPDPDPGGGGVGQPKMCIPPGKILGTPLSVGMDIILVFLNCELGQIGLFSGPLPCKTIYLKPVLYPAFHSILVLNRSL
jgi:hypothetical protein